MINIAIHSSDFNFDDTLELLDPVAGKGTTLFEAATFGFHAFGIEVEGNALQEGQTFFKKFMEQERFKHSRSKRVIYKNQESRPAEITEFGYAINKDDFKNEATRKHLGMIHGASKEAHKYFKKERFHVIVGDLPYGIKHGNKGGKVYGSPTRNPADLVIECLPEWKKVIRKGGSIVLAWNSHLINRKNLGEIFQQEGFELMTEGAYAQFEHRVDSAIKRDVIVARKI
jgi:tRNA G10  N-methylase Trm11